MCGPKVSRDHLRFAEFGTRFGTRNLCVAAGSPKRHGSRFAAPITASLGNPKLSCLVRRRPILTGISGQEERQRFVRAAAGTYKYRDTELRRSEDSPVLQLWKPESFTRSGWDRDPALPAGGRSAVVNQVIERGKQPLDGLRLYVLCPLRPTRHLPWLPWIHGSMESTSLGGTGGVLTNRGRRGRAATPETNYRLTPRGREVVRKMRSGTSCQGREPCKRHSR
jgi:hypothetical protein